MNESVIKLVKENNIGIVAMEEREFKNTLTERFIKSLKETFDEIASDQELKVIVLHGYDNYFCCGGTKEGLIRLSKGDINYTDLFSCDLLLKCELPVIAAMQGHALGGGFVFGCSADILVMGEECIYSTNFMKYGFTPGGGATLIIPEKFGSFLGTEMLIRGETYLGRELKERGANAKIVKKKDVIDTAMNIASDIAEKPILSVKLLKKHLAKPLNDKLDDAIKEEIKMHKLTFVQPEVLVRIETLF